MYLSGLAHHIWGDKPDGCQGDKRVRGKDIAKSTSIIL